MTEKQSLINYILTDPYDDTQRLVYADWLDEHEGAAACGHCKGLGSWVNHEHDADGNRLRNVVGCSTCGGRGHLPNPLAEFVRVQVELAAGNDYGSGRKYEERRQVLRRREGELFAAKFAEWFPAPAGRVCRRPVGNTGTEIQWADSSGVILLVVRRGFVDEVWLSAAAFLGGPCERCSGTGVVGVSEHYSTDGYLEDITTPPCLDCKGERRTPGCAANLFASQPVTRVVLAGTEPYETIPGREWIWHRAQPIGLLGASALPDELYLQLPTDGDGLTRYPTRADALDALSAACVMYGRQDAIRKGLVNSQVAKVWGIDA
jgi:uncharacterized protein (TIGR02996 family)